MLLLIAQATMENDTSKPIVRVEAVLHQVIRIHTQDTHKHTHTHNACTA